MSEVYMMVTITDWKEAAVDFLEFYQANHVDANMVTLGRGTANSEMLDYLGWRSRRRQ